jgi:tetratricopeptide (TPR) repeat protein
VKELIKHGVTVVPISVMPWRFDVARGTALNLLPADIDVCIWQDLDEALLPGWRQHIERNWTAQTTTANHRYRNNSNPWQWHSKIHARHGCHWTGAVHETLKWHRDEHAIWLSDVYLDEQQDTGKDRRGYLDLLEKKVAEGDHHWRTYYFLANEYQSQQRYGDALHIRRKSYDSCDEGAVIQSYIARNIAGGYASQGDPDSARRWYRISTDHSNERESWFAYAEFCYNQRDWEECYLAARRCLSVTERRNGFTQDPRAWSDRPYDIAALAAYNIGLYRQALQYGQQALDMLPTDARLQKNLAFYQEAAHG